MSCTLFPIRLWHRDSQRLEAPVNNLSVTWCRFQTLYEIFSELNRSGSGRSEAPERGPVLLLLGGGMAAGKSTVREIIGHDDFWSKVPPHARIYLVGSMLLCRYYCAGGCHGKPDDYGPVSPLSTVFVPRTWRASRSKCGLWYFVIRVQACRWWNVDSRGWCCELRY